MEGPKNGVACLLFSHECVSVLGCVKLLVSCGEDGREVFVTVVLDSDLCVLNNDLI